MKQTIGIVGLGPMGKTIAINLLGADFSVFGYDIRSELRYDLESYGGVSLSSITEIANSVDLLITSLPNSSALDLVIDDVLKNPRTETVFIETSTLTLDQKLKAAKRLGDDGISLLDCPISGTPTMLANMTASIYVSGDEELYTNNL